MADTNTDDDMDGTDEVETGTNHEMQCIESSWIHLFKSHSTDLTGFVSSLQDLRELVTEFELATFSRFIIHRTRKDFGGSIDLKKYEGKLHWYDVQKEAHPNIVFDGIPFIIMGTRVMDCQHGRNYDGRRGKERKERQNKKKDEEHSYSVKRRRLVQTTRKLDCQAKLYIRHIVKFPGFKVHDMNNKHGMSAMSAQLKSAMKNQDDIVLEHQYHVELSTQHTNHIEGQMATSVQTIDKRLSEYIHQKVKEESVFSSREMKLLCEEYVKTNLFQGKRLPARHNTRFFPTLSQIRNHMVQATMHCRDSAMDQDQLHEMVLKWQDTTDDFIEYRRKSNATQANTEQYTDCDSDNIIHNLGQQESSFLYVHMTRWQQRLLLRYGQELVLLDATYRTSKYSLPLFLLAVPTNVHYIVVACFIVEVESTEAISEALKVIRKWTPEWKPRYFMTDYSEQEIQSVETTFRDVGTFVFLCDFHRLQAWNRWVNATIHGVQPTQKSPLLNSMKRVAESEDEGELKRNIEVLFNEEEWKKNSNLRTWFQKHYLDKKKRWIKMYRQDRVNAINTTNGIERQNGNLKHGYLWSIGYKRSQTISQLVHIIVNRYFPDCMQRYVQENIKSSSAYKSYDEDVPPFLHNRPYHFVQHTMKRWIEAQDMRSNITINDVGNGVFTVGSSQNDLLYTVEIDNGNGMPSCQCVDWKRHHFPCKHLLVVLLSDNNRFTWDDLPSNYKDSPYFSLDLLRTSTTDCLNDEVENTLDDNIPDDQDKLETDVEALQRQLRFVLKHCENLSYIVTSQSSLNTAITAVGNINRMLDVNCPKDGLFITEPNVNKPIIGSATGRLQCRKGSRKTAAAKSGFKRKNEVIVSPLTTRAKRRKMQKDNGQSSTVEVVQELTGEELILEPEETADASNDVLRAAVEKGDVLIPRDADPRVRQAKVEKMIKDRLQTALSGVSKNKNDKPGKVRFTEKAMQFKERKMAELKKCSPDPFPGGGLLNPPRMNLCFANSLLQCLRLADMHKVLQHHKNCKDNFCFTCGLKEFFEMGPITAQPLCEKMTKVWPNYTVGQQQDPYEMYTKIMEEVQAKCFNKLTCMSDERRIFYGQLQYSYSCKTCGSKSNSTAPFTDLPLSIVKHQTLSQCLEEHFSEEKVDKTCLCCRKNTEHSRLLQLKSVPKNLVLNLNRFTNARKKVMKKIDLHLNLNLRQYVVENGKEEHKLDLFGVVIHKGQTLSTGHYITLVKFGTDWYRVDDMKIQKLSTGFLGVIDGQPTMLFYRTLKRPYVTE